MRAALKPAFVLSTIGFHLDFQNASAYHFGAMPARMFPRIPNITRH
jgi:hypothetical protein